MKRLSIFAVLLVSFAVWAEVNIEYTTPNIVVADENEAPIDGVSGSQNILNATQKVIELRKDGVYKLIRPSITMEVTGNEAVVIDPPVDSDGDGIPDATDECPNDATNKCNVDEDGDGVTDDVDQCLNTPAGAVVDATGCEVVVIPTPTALIDCPDTPTSETASRSWTLCAINSIAFPEYTANESDYKMSFRVPKALTPENKGRVTVYMHPSTSGEQFVTGSDSFTYTLPQGNRQIEIHTLEQTVGVNPDGVQNSGGWWAWSGFGREAGTGNYNGKQIAASIDYILDHSEYGQLVDIEKGIHLKGTSLGGAGAYMQAYILPKYQDKIAIASSFYGVMNMAMIENEGKVKGGWGSQVESPELYAAIDSRIGSVWRKGQNIFWHWAGGSDDGLGRMDFAFIDRCNTSKIACSLRWLKSGHGVNEVGYTLPHALFLDDNQDVTLDKILPVITNNSANFITPDRGQINRGMSWHHANIVDTVDEIIVPLRYVAQKGVGPDFPDMPDDITFDLTLRHVKNFDTAVGTVVDWTFGAGSGTAVVGGDGLLTIPLGMTTGTEYKVLSVKKYDGGVIVTPPVGGVLTKPIVYSWVKRTTGTYTVTLANGEQYTDDHWDWMDKLAEVSRQYDSFNAPGAMEILNIDGTSERIFDCFAKEKPCVPMDANVSLDGKKIAFAVYQADNLVHTYPANRKYPAMVLGTTNTESKIYIYDVESKELTAWPHTPGSHDTAPTWMPGGKMMFTSNRAGFWQPRLNKIGTGANQEPRIYLANQDGTNAVDISPHELAGSLHPYLLLDGRVIYSAKWMSHNLPYKTGSQINWPGTTGNKWVAMSITQDGGDFAALLGAHQSRLVGLNGRTNTKKALHFFGQMQDGSFLFDNYYRSNNLGLGDIGIADLWEHPLEGPAPSFTPPIRMSATWSTSEDAYSFTDDNGIYLGKTGHPEGVDDNQIMMTVGRGICTQIAAGIPGTNDRLKASGNKGCDTGIYRTSVIPSQHPDDLVKIVDDPNRHEFMAREIRARAVPVRLANKTTDGSCQLVSTDAYRTDALHYGGDTPCIDNPSLNCGGYDFNNEGKYFANNGALMEAVPHSEMTGIRFYEVLGNTTKAELVKNSIGNEVRFLGDVPLLDDGSFKAELPCSTAYLMGGIDKDNRLIKRDQVAQSLIPGEKRVCTGCHLHSEKGRDYADSMAFNAQPFKLGASIAVPTYTDDVLPILLDKCAGCHNPDAAVGEDVPLYTYQGLALDYFQEQVPPAMKVQTRESTNEKLKHGLHRTLLSKYVDTMYAKASLLFWKVVNKRTDGRTDSLYNDDVDFGADHPTNVTQVEINIIGDWLDSGATR